MSEPRELNTQEEQPPSDDYEGYTAEEQPEDVPDPSRDPDRGGE